MHIKFAEKVAIELVKNQKIKLEDQELYQYGIEQGILILLNVLTALAIGLIFHCLFYIVIFSVVFVPLRTNSGGFHAKTSLRCYILSVITLVLFCISIKVLRFPNIIWIIIGIVCSIIILVLSPVETENKPLDKLEIKVYQKRACLIWIVEALSYTLSFILDLKFIWLSITFSWLALSVMLLAGMIVNRTRSKSIHIKT